MEKDNIFSRLIRIFYMPILYQLIGSIVGTIVYIVIEIDLRKKIGYESLFFNKVLEQYQRQAMLITLITAVITIPICCYLYQRDRKKEIECSKVMLYEKAKVRQWIFVPLLGITSCIALNNWISFSGLMKIFPGFEEIAELLYSGSFLIEILAIAIAAPVAEELLFRGLVYQRFAEFTTKKTAAVLSALSFGIYHFNIVQGIYAFLLGILLIYVYEKFHTLWAPIIFHMSANLISVILTELGSGQEISNEILLLLTIGCTILGGFCIWYLQKRVNLSPIQK